MKKVIRLTESDLTRIVKRVIKEQSNIQKYKNGETFFNEKINAFFKINSFNNETKEYDALFSGYDGGGNFDSFDIKLTETKIDDWVKKNMYKKISQQEYNSKLKGLPLKK